MKRICVLLGLAVAAGAQTATIEFEAVDLRVADPGEVTTEGFFNGAVVRIQRDGGRTTLAPVYEPNGRVTLRGVTMRDLITQAYKEILRPEYLSGGPGWLDSDRFTLIAKAPAGTPVDTERLMLQSALARRVHLEVHREPRPMPVFALSVAKSGLKASRAAGTGDPDNCPRVASPAGTIRRSCHGVSMALLADRLPSLAGDYVDKPAVDATGADGVFDFELQWVPRPANGDVAAGATFQDALEKLGLKLEEKRAPITVIVINRVDRAPSQE